jgi:hypothetical protein
MTNLKRQYFVGLDFSGSMAWDSSIVGLTRWEEAQEIVSSVIKKTMQYDPDGVDVTLFGTSLIHHKEITIQKLQEIFALEPEMAGTDLLSLIKYYVTDFINNIQSVPEYAATYIILTDGSPNSGQEQLIMDLLRKVAGILNENNEKQLAFSFLQVGNDSKATKFLKILDDSLNASFDIVDTKTPADFATMSVDQYLENAIND